MSEFLVQFNVLCGVYVACISIFSLVFSVQQVSLCGWMRASMCLSLHSDWSNDPANRITGNWSGPVKAFKQVG
jgi:hypothetical protein